MKITIFERSASSEEAILLREYAASWELPVKEDGSNVAVLDNRVDTQKLPGGAMVVFCGEDWAEREVYAGEFFSEEEVTRYKDSLCTGSK